MKKGGGGGEVDVRDVGKNLFTSKFLKGGEREGIMKGALKT